MKKTICMLMVLALAIAFSGCLSACDKEDNYQQEPRKLGDFYTLQEAYENGFLTQEDVESIADYHVTIDENETETAGKPCPVPLTADTEAKIKETFAYDLRHDAAEPIADAKPEDVLIKGYYGTYGNCVVLNRLYKSRSWSWCVMEETEVAGIRFYHDSSLQIYVWIGH